MSKHALRIILDNGKPLTHYAMQACALQALYTTLCASGHPLTLNRTVSAFLSVDKNMTAFATPCSQIFLSEKATTAVLAAHSSLNNVVTSIMQSSSAPEQRTVLPRVRRDLAQVRRAELAIAHVSEPIDRHLGGRMRRRIQHVTQRVQPGALTRLKLIRARGISASKVRRPVRKRATGIRLTSAHKALQHMSSRLDSALLTRLTGDSLTPTSAPSPSRPYPPWRAAPLPPMRCNSRVLGHTTRAAAQLGLRTSQDFRGAQVGRNLGLNAFAFAVECLRTT